MLTQGKLYKQRPAPLEPMGCAQLDSMQKLSPICVVKVEQLVAQWQKRVPSLTMTILLLDVLTLHFGFFVSDFHS